MRQPLHVIWHYTERLLKDPAICERNRNRLQTILKNAADLDFLVEDILDCTQILSRDVIVSTEAIDVDSLLNEVKAHHPKIAAQRNVDLIALNMLSGEFETDRFGHARCVDASD